LKEDEARQERARKVLLLGGPEAGKSTLGMLVRALHGGLSSDQERLDYLPIVWCGVLNGVQALIAAARAHGVPFDTAALSALADEIAAMHAFDTPLTAALGEKLRAVHECGAVQRVLAEHARDASLSSAHTTRC
jgi:hypothetical protein